MHTSSRAASGLVVAILTLGGVQIRADLQQAQTPRASTEKNGFELTVDSIMRGPKLVGYPPSGLVMKLFNLYVPNKQHIQPCGVMTYGQVSRKSATA